MLFALQSTDEQKLIYSGQLLSDSVVLKDVLRQYEGQETHTVHLVYTPKNMRYPPKKSEMKDTSKSSSAQPATTATTTTRTSPASSSSTDGLR